MAPMMVKDRRSSYYTTTNICEIFDIGRDRLKDWISWGYVNPTYRSHGHGDKNLFTAYDLYRIGLFINLHKITNRSFASAVANRVADDIFDRKEKIGARLGSLKVEINLIGAMDMVKDRLEKIREKEGAKK